MLACAVLAAGTAAAQDGPPACADAELLVGSAATRERAIRSISCLVNRERARHGRRALKRSRSLERAARGHGASMVTHRYESHLGRGGTTPRDRARRAGYVRGGQQFRAGEAITWVTGMHRTPQGIVRRLLQSAAHTSIVRRARYRDIGVGLAFGAPRATANPGLTLVLMVGRRIPA